ncbi:phytoene desaturase family protein, partial [Chloroflexota bacterium]
GAHGFMTVGSSEVLFERLGIPMPEIEFWDDVYFDIDGKWEKLEEIIELANIPQFYVENVLPLSQEEMEKYADVGFLDWLKTKTDDKRAHTFLDIMSWGMVLGGIETSSATETLIGLKNWATATTSATQLKSENDLPRGSGTPKGGFAALNRILEDKCKELGAEIRTNARVVDVVIEDGVAKGVEVLTGDRVMPTQLMDTELIEAPVVVSSVPLWSLFSVVSEDRFPQWYVEWVKYISSHYATLGTLFYGIEGDMPMGDDHSIWMVRKFPRTGVAGGLLPFPAYCNGTGQHQIAFWFQANWYDGPAGLDSSTWDSAKNRHAVKEWFDLWEEDCREYFPGFEERCVWKVRQIGRAHVSPLPANTRMYRPGVKPPGAKGFYLSSDTLRDWTPMGLAGAATCAMKCVDTILEEE